MWIGKMTTGEAEAGFTRRLCIRSIALISGQVMQDVIPLQAALIQWRVEHSTYSDR